MKTPIKELLEHVQTLKSKGQEIDTNGLEAWLNSVAIPKEKEQREELIKEAHIAGNNLGCENTQAFFTGHKNKVEPDQEILKEQAEKYYKEVIKPKYLK